MKHLKIGLVALGFAMLLASGVVLYGGNRADAQYGTTNVSVKVNKDEVAVNVPTDTALTAFDRFLDRFLPAKEEKESGNVFGAVSSPDLMSSWYRVGGITYWRYRTDSLNSASTTLCSFESPAASSTLQSATLYLDYSSTSAMVIEVAKAGWAQATTTLLNSYEVAANSKATIHASTTVVGESLDFKAIVQNVATTTDDDENDFLSFTAYGIGANWGDTQTFSPTGHCQVEWREL